MSTKTPDERRPARDRGPSIRASPELYLFPYKIQVLGDGWGPCPVAFQLDEERQVSPARILQGEGQGKAVKPVNGQFIVLFGLPLLPQGKHRVTATSVQRGKKTEAHAEFTIAEVPDTEKDGRPTNRWFRRREHFFRQRFPDGANPLPGSLYRALVHRDQLRRRWGRERDFHNVSGRRLVTRFRRQSIDRYEALLDVALQHGS